MYVLWQELYLLHFFNAMTVYFLYADFNSIENLSSIALDLINFIWTAWCCNDYIRQYYAKTTNELNRRTENSMEYEK